MALLLTLPPPASPLAPGKITPSISILISDQETNIFYSGTPAGTPSASATPVYNGAGALSGSMGLAGVAAMAAFVLA